MDFCRLKIQCTEIDFYNNIFQKSSTDQEGDRYVVCNMFHNITKSMHVYGVAKVSLHWDDKRDPPLDHRVLDQRWISGRFLVDCSDSDLFLHAWNAKFFDVNYKLNVKNTFQLKFNSRNRQLNALCTPRSLLLGFLP